MSETLDEFTYELTSKQIRRYKVNALQSVRRAITSNIQDYLGYQGVCDTQVSLWSIAPNIVVIIAGLMIFVQWVMQLPIEYVYYEIVGFYVLLILKHVWDRKFVLADLVFEGTGNVVVKDHSKPFVKTLGETKKKLRVFLHYTEKNNAMLLKMELVEDSLFPTSSELVLSAEKKILYSRYFSEQGFFYSFNMIKDVDSVLNRLLERYLA